MQAVLKHRDFTTPQHVSLYCNAAGRIELGNLDGITNFSVSADETAGANWDLTGQDNQHTVYRPSTRRPTNRRRSPTSAARKTPVRTEFSLLERRAGAFVKDYFENLSLENGLLLIKGLPPGDYELFLKKQAIAVTVRIGDGSPRDGDILGNHRLLEQGAYAPLQIASVETTPETLTVQLKNTSKFARVHVVATRYINNDDPFNMLGLPLEAPSLTSYKQDPALFLNGRDIGDEYRYILERKQASKFIGNMLKRPGLLLNPWALRDTGMGQQNAAAGEEYDERGGGEGRGATIGRAGGGRRASQPFVGCMDFLGDPAPMLLNLKPDAQGVVKIPRKDLAGNHIIRVIAVEPEHLASKTVVLPETPLTAKDLRMKLLLDVAKHFIEKKKTTVVEAAKAFTMEDITGSAAETYDTLPKVYGLLRTMSGDATLTEFDFITRWPSLKPEEKREKFSKHACHELSFFLFKKDRAVLQRVRSRPYLVNKKDKTFLDRWLHWMNDLTSFTAAMEL